MKIAIAFAGHFERSAENSWRPAWPFFKKHLYETNRQHEIFTVFHTWEQPTQEMLDTLQPAAWEVGKQVVYDDSKIPAGPKKVSGYQGIFYNNFKNRLHSYSRAVELTKAFKPDLIFLTRPDVVIRFDIRVDHMALSRDEIHVGNWVAPKHHFVCDHYFLGHHEVLERMVKLEDHYKESMFDVGASYHDWIVARQEKGRLLKDQNWLAGHTVYPWFFYTNGIKWHNLGRQDGDTWVVRQALKNGMASVPAKLEPYDNPFVFSKPEPVWNPPAAIEKKTSTDKVEIHACPHCGQPLPDDL